MYSPKRDRIQTLGGSSLTQQPTRDPREPPRTSPTPTKREEFMSTLIKPRLSERALKKPITETGLCQHTVQQDDKFAALKEWEYFWKFLMIFSNFNPKKITILAIFI